MELIYTGIQTVVKDVLIIKCLPVVAEYYVAYNVVATDT